MASVVALASLALVLAAIEYYLGAALYSSGFFNRGFRASGREMMQNATLSVVLASSWGLILSLVNFVASVLYPNGLNGAYDHLYGWVTIKTGTSWATLMVLGTVQWSISLVQRIITGILPILIGFGPIPGVAFAEPVSRLYSSLTAPWVAMLQTSYIVLTVSSNFGTILQASWFVFVAYGSLAYALPKQLGRSIGGSLIAGAVTFYVGLPLMPDFVDYFTDLARTELNLASVNCATIQQYLSGYQCNPSLPFNMDINQLWYFSIGLAPSINFQIYSAAVLPVIYLGILTAIVSGVAKLLGSAQLSLLPGGLL
jgi:uncharacterized membrane protein